MSRDLIMGLGKIGIGVVGGVSSMKPNWIDPSWVGMLLAVYGAVSSGDQATKSTLGK